jgi:hypothetical protein
MYCAYVIDPLGNNIEVLYFRPWIFTMREMTPLALSGLLGIILAVGFSYYLT